MMNIGQRIKQRREELGISQEELAKKAGYKSRSSINKIEVDGRGLPQSKIVLIARALKTTPTYLMGWETSTEINPNSVEELNQLASIASVYGYVNDCFGKNAEALLTSYELLNDAGKKEALKRIQEMVHIPEYVD